MIVDLKNIRLTASHAFPFLMLLAFASPTVLKSQEVSVSIQSEHNNYLIGEHAVINIIASADRLISIQWPELNDTLSDGLFLLRTAPVDTLRATDGIYHYQQSVIVSAYDSGNYTFPPVMLTFTRHGSETPDSAVTSSLSLFFTFPGIESEAELRDIRDPLAVPFAITELIPWLVAVIAAALLFLLVKRHLKKRSQHKVKHESAQQTISVQQPWEAALEALDILRRSEIVTEKEIKAYYIELSGIIRNYIRDGLGIDAPEMTTRQTLRRLASLPGIDPENNMDITYILETSDLVKFAKLKPDSKGIEKVIDRAVRFVKGTAPAHIETIVEEATE